MSFVAGKGVRLNSKDSYVNYRIATLTEGEFSFEAENIGNGSEDYKTKVLSMQDCCGDLDRESVSRHRGQTVERVWLEQSYPLSDHLDGDYSDAVGGGQNWDRSKTYFWEFTWRAGVARLRVWLGGRMAPSSRTWTRHTRSLYNPSDHLARLGSVGGRGGNESLPGVIIRYVSISRQSASGVLGVGVSEP